MFNNIDLLLLLFFEEMDLKWKTQADYPNKKTTETLKISFLRASSSCSAT